MTGVTVRSKNGRTISARSTLARIRRSRSASMYTVISGSSGMRSWDHSIDDERNLRVIAPAVGHLGVEVARLLGGLTGQRDAGDQRELREARERPARDHDVRVAQRECAGQSVHRLTNDRDRGALAGRAGEYEQCRARADRFQRHPRGDADLKLERETLWKRRLGALSGIAGTGSRRSLGQPR